jgi:hypothetical protein
MKEDIKINKKVELYEKELKLINWFLFELKNNKEVNIDNNPGVFFNCYNGNIKNMNFNIYGEHITLISKNNLFSNKFDANIEYEIKNNENEIYFYVELYKFQSKFNLIKNETLLNNFIDKNIDKK